MVEERDGNYINLYRWKVSIPILPKIGAMKHILMTVSILLVLWGIAEAVYGGLQLYGLAESNHSLYNITGSFRNPGPYAGFLAVILPVALYLALNCRTRSRCLRQGTVALCWVYLFLCATLLPATLSRAAWIAACVGCGIVLCARYRLRARCILYFRRHRRRAWAWLSAACLLLALAGVGAYYLKKDSADGRLLMWKVTARVIADAPYTGTGPVVHPRPKTQLINQDKIPRHDGRLYGIAGDGIKIHHKQPEHCCNQQRNDNDGAYCNRVLMNFFIIPVIFLPRFSFYTIPISAS